MRGVLCFYERQCGTQRPDRLLRLLGVVAVGKSAQGLMLLAMVGSRSGMSAAYCTILPGMVPGQFVVAAALVVGQASAGAFDGV